MFSSQRLGGCRFSAKLLWLTCRTSLPAIICVRPVLHRQKAFKKPLERYCTTGIYKYFIMITTSFQQETALKHSRCLTAAQTAAKRTIRADLPSARQPKKKSSAGRGWGMGMSLPSVVSAYRMFRENPSASSAFLSDTRVSSPRLLPVVNGMKSIRRCGVACARFLLTICTYNCEKN